MKLQADLWDQAEHVSLDVDMEDSSYLGFVLRLRPSEALRRFACVCIFMQGFEVVLLNASFGCIGELFFNLAWQAYCWGLPPHTAASALMLEAFEAGFI